MLKQKEYLTVNINRFIYIGLIASFLLIFVVDRHFAIPFALAECFAFFNLLKFDISLSEFIPFLLIVIGQLLFLFLGARKSTIIKFWLLLISPLLIIIGLLLFTTRLSQYHQWFTIKTMIPFWLVSILFYVDVFRKFKNRSLNEKD